jgi:hypothetical protein
MALTDHDTCAGVGEAAVAAREAGIELLAGVEISAGLGDLEVHIVGLGVDPEDTTLSNTLATVSEARRNRARNILQLLGREGIDVTLPDSVPVDAIGRMHIARVLFDEGHTNSTQDGFDRYLNPGRPAWVPKATVPVTEAIGAIHAAGGLAFVAHPGLSRALRKALKTLLEMPFDGIEAYHVSHGRGRTAEYIALAEDRDLLVSGGSDCHGLIKGKTEMGNVRMPLRFYEAIRDRLDA